MHEQREYPIGWRHDCQGKQDYDGRLVEVSTRYWPPNYDPHGQHTAHSSILLGGMAVTDSNFTAPTMAKCKRQVEQWVASQIKIVETAIISAFTTVAISSDDEDDEPDHLPDDIEPPDDTPSLANCDDAGTGEGRWHGRI